jgi:isoprenylcysteine carboxyl methyltransferase (ICMT) family protein YpbQ
MNLGVRKLFHDILYHRERFRQFLGISFMIIVSIISQPMEIFFFSGALLVILGILVRLWASGNITKNKSLATDGPYAYVRHPLYVGNIILGFGFALASGLWWSIPLMIGILLVFYPPAIQQEDKKLHRKFKEEWEQWAQRTRATIPRVTPYRPIQAIKWSFRQSMRQNGEPVIALFMVFLLYVIYLRLY